MKWRGLLGLGILLSFCLPAQARVRLGWKDGRRVVYNDGIGESVHAALAQNDGWLKARVETPSLFDGLIEETARVHSLDPKLVKSVMLVESAFNPAAVSRKGARGLMQLMPETAARHGVQRIFDPAENIQGGARHLAYLMGLFGNDLPRSLAAYNAGEAAVLRYGGIPPYDETRLYVHKALTAYYGKSSLSGGFGLPAGTTYGKAKGRKVHVRRDENNRVILTTEPVPRPAAREAL
ncbi:MAG: lytic transglycosylase domain-containing protein [Thermoanaerobaculia bacterium]